MENYKEEKFDPNEQHKWTPGHLIIPYEISSNYDLKATEVLLFGYIQNLSRTERGCWASNAFLGSLIGADNRTVRKHLSRLKEFGYIIVQFVALANRESERRIFENPDFRKRYKDHARGFMENSMSLYAEFLKNKQEGGEEQTDLGGEGPNGPTPRAKKSSEYSRKNSSSKEEVKKTASGVSSEPPSSSFSSEESFNKGNQSKRPTLKSKPIQKVSGVSNETPFVKSTKKPTLKVKKNDNASGDSSNPPLAKSKETDPPPANQISIAAQVNTILAFWKNAGLKTPSAGTKTEKENKTVCKELLLGKRFNGQRISEAEILRAIQNYALAALNQDYQPLNKTFLQSLYFHTFVFNAYNSNGNSSMFVKYLNTKPDLFKGLKNNYVPEDETVFQTIIKHFLSKVLSDTRLKKLSAKEENDFAHCTNRLIEFFRANMKRFAFGFNINLLVKEFCEMAEQLNKKSTLTSYYYNSDRLLDIEFPQFLKKKGIINSVQSKPVVYKQA